MHAPRLTAAGIAALALLAGVTGFVRTGTSTQAPPHATAAVTVPARSAPPEPPDRAEDADPAGIFERTAAARTAAFAYREDPAPGGPQPATPVEFIGLVDLDAGFQRVRLGNGLEIRAGGDGGVELRERGQSWRVASDDERLVLAEAWQRIGVREILTQLRAFERRLVRVGDDTVRGVAVAHWATPASGAARVEVWLDAHGRAHRVVVGRDPVTTLDLWDHGLDGPLDGAPLPSAVPEGG